MAREDIAECIIALTRVRTDDCDRLGQLCDHRTALHLNDDDNDDDDDDETTPTIYIICELVRTRSIGENS